MAKAKVVKVLACPKCGWDAKEDGEHDYCFRWFEEVVVERRVVGVNAKGVLELEGDDLIDAVDSNTSSGLRCGNCLHSFPVPVGLQVERT